MTALGAGLVSQFPPQAKAARTKVVRRVQVEVAIRVRVQRRKLAEGRHRRAALPQVARRTKLVVQARVLAGAARQEPAQGQRAPHRLPATAPVAAQSRTVKPSRIPASPVW